MIYVAQKQTIQTNLIEDNIGKSQEQLKCRMCKRAEEAMTYIVSECHNFLRKSKKEAMIGSKNVFIGEIPERMKSMLNQKLYEH